MIAKNCYECLTPFKAYRERNKFCSRLCYELHRSRKLTIYCVTCDKPIKISKTSTQKYCSHSCAASKTNIEFPKRSSQKIQCKNCTKLVNNYLATFCSSKCHNEYSYNEYITKWLSGVESGTNKWGCTAQVRKWIKELYGMLCWECGWNKPHPVDGIPPLQIDHIDGDASNNRPENLRLLCPSCHSLTVTYGSRNKNSTRLYRYNKVQ